MTQEPNLDIAHLGHLEILTPTFDKSARFFIDVMGMTQSGEKGDSIYLRGYDDYERYTLKLTASKTNGMAHVAYRCRSPQALRAARRRAEGLRLRRRLDRWRSRPRQDFRLQGSGRPRHRALLRHRMVRAAGRAETGAEKPGAGFPGRGCNVRRLDHWNGLAADISACRKFFEDYLGFRLTERIVLNDGSEAGIWFTATNKSYDFAYTRDHTGARGRFHHVTYALNSREEVLLAADIFLENGVFIETGPHKHAIQQTFFLYVYEPGGNRVEVANAGAKLILAPDWKPITWTEEERKKGQAWGLKTIESFHTHGTPAIPARAKA